MQWLMEVFLEYFKEWKEEINGLVLSKTEKKKLTLSQETLVGLEITGTCTIFSHTPYCNRITCYCTTWIVFTIYDCVA